MTNSDAEQFANNVKLAMKLGRRCQELLDKVMKYRMLVIKLRYDPTIKIPNAELNGMKRVIRDILE